MGKISERFMRWFKRDRTPNRVDLDDIYQNFYDLGQWLVDNIPEGPEKTAGMRKLMEAKDCMVRGRIEVLGDPE